MNPALEPKGNVGRVRGALRRAWGRVRWKMLAVVTLTGGTTLLVTCLAIAIINVVVRRESANVVEKQIQSLVQISRSIAPAVLDNVGGCTTESMNTARLRPLLSYTDEAFPQAQLSLRVEDHNGVHFPLPPTNVSDTEKPDWLRADVFTGLVVEQGRVEILNLAEHKTNECVVTAIFKLPLGPDLARRLTFAGDTRVTEVIPTRFRVHPANQQILRTIAHNFVPGSVRAMAVVLTVHDWKTGALEDWRVYTAQTAPFKAFEDLASLGSQRANWFWLLGALSTSVLLLYASGVWMGTRFSRQIVAAIEDLSVAARQIGSGNFEYRTPVRAKDQLGDLASSFNEMTVALERLHHEELVKQELENEIQVAHRVQNYLFPRIAPALPGTTVSGRTHPARLIGGDLYDFFDFGQDRIGVLCADVSGKGIPAALMMANLQAIAHAHAGSGNRASSLPPAEFVEILNRELTGRFGNSRYATLFWAEYDARTRVLEYVNAGHPAPILIHSPDRLQRMDSDAFPIGMFGSARYAAKKLDMKPGSRLVVFTDGLTDALNDRGEEFGDEQLAACCQSIGAGMNAEAIAETVTRTVAEWSANVEQFDDTTVVVIAVDF